MSGKCLAILGVSEDSRLSNLRKDIQLKLGSRLEYMAPISHS